MEKQRTDNLLNTPMVYEAGGQEIKLTGNMVKSYLTKGNAAVTDQEVVMFMNLCKYQQLNPFLNEAYLVKFGNQPAQIITSKEAYMKRAYENPSFNGFKAGIIIKRGDEILEEEGSFSLPGDQLVGGWARVYVKGKEHPYVTKITMEEFSKSQATWKSMPRTMIRKTALVQALREAFPDNLGAMYTEDESVEGETNTVEMEVQEEIEKEANKEVLDIEDADFEIVEEEPEERTEPQQAPAGPAEKQESIFDGPGF